MYFCVRYNIPDHGNNIPTFRNNARNPWNGSRNLRNGFRNLGNGFRNLWNGPRNLWNGSHNLWNGSRNLWNGSRNPWNSAPQPRNNARILQWCPNHMVLFLKAIDFTLRPLRLGANRLTQRHRAREESQHHKFRTVGFAKMLAISCI